MAIELQYKRKKTIPINQIEELIYSLGWFKIGADEYRWFKPDNYASIRGVSLKVYNTPEDELVSNQNGTEISVNTYAGRSFYDLEAQNYVVKCLKKGFGGAIYNPQEGNGSYIDSWFPDLDEVERQLNNEFTKYIVNLDRALEMIQEVEPVQGNARFREYKLSFNKGILRNNSVIPFVVSAWESFLKDFLCAFIRTNATSKNKMYEKIKRVDSISIRKLVEGKLKIEEWFARQQNFQNLEIANKNYRELIGIDLFAILSKRKQVSRKRYYVRQIIQDTIILRHEIIHRAHLDLELDKGKTSMIVGYFRIAGNLFADEIFRVHGKEINLEKYL